VVWDTWADKDGRASPFGGVSGDIEVGGKIAWRVVDGAKTRLNLLEANDRGNVSADEEEFFVVGKIATAVSLQEEKEGSRRWGGKIEEKEDEWEGEVTMGF